MASTSTSTVFRYLTVVKRDGSDGSRFPIKNHSVVLGRSPDADIRILLDTVSQHHCSFQTDFNGQISLVNMSKTHQLTVNGESLTSKSLQIKHGDTVNVGGRQFRYEEVERTSSQLARRSLKRKLSNQNLVGAPQPKSPRPGPSQVDNVLTTASVKKLTPSVSGSSNKRTPVLTARTPSIQISLKKKLVVSSSEKRKTPASLKSNKSSTPGYLKTTVSSSAKSVTPGSGNLVKTNRATSSSVKGTPVTTGIMDRFTSASSPHLRDAMTNGLMNRSAVVDAGGSALADQSNGATLDVDVSSVTRRSRRSRSQSSHLLDDSTMNLKSAIPSQNSSGIAINDGGQMIESGYAYGLDMTKVDNTPTPFKKNTRNRQSSSLLSTQSTRHPQSSVLSTTAAIDSLNFSRSSIQSTMSDVSATRSRRSTSLMSASAAGSTPGTRLQSAIPTYGLEMSRMDNTPTPFKKNTVNQDQSSFSQSAAAEDMDSINLSTSNMSNFGLSAVSRSRRSTSLMSPSGQTPAGVPSPKKSANHQPNIPRVIVSDLSGGTEDSSRGSVNINRGVIDPGHAYGLELTKVDVTPTPFKKRAKVHQSPSVTTGDAKIVSSTPYTPADRTIHLDIGVLPLDLSTIGESESPLNTSLRRSERTGANDSSASSVDLHLAISGDEEESSYTVDATTNSFNVSFVSAKNTSRTSTKSARRPSTGRGSSSKKHLTPKSATARRLSGPRKSLLRRKTLPAGNRMTPSKRVSFHKSMISSVKKFRKEESTINVSRRSITSSSASFASPGSPAYSDRSSRSNLASTSTYSTVSTTGRDERSILIETPENQINFDTEDNDSNSSLLTDVTPKKSVAILVNSSNKSPKTPKLSGIRQLAKTPTKSPKTPKLAGIRQLTNTPPKSPATPDYSGIERMVKTPRGKPKSPKTPAFDGIVRMTTTPNRKPRSPKTPALDGIVRLVKTPKQQPKTPNFDGMAEMMKSPVRLPRNSMAGVGVIPSQTGLLKMAMAGANRERVIADSVKSVFVKKATLAVPALQKNMMSKPLNLAVNSSNQTVVLKKTCVNPMPIKAAPLKVSPNVLQVPIMSSKQLVREGTMQTPAVASTEQLVEVGGGLTPRRSARKRHSPKKFEDEKQNKVMKAKVMIVKRLPAKKVEPVFLPQKRARKTVVYSEEDEIEQSEVEAGPSETIEIAKKVVAKRKPSAKPPVVRPKRGAAVIDLVIEPPSPVTKYAKKQVLSPKKTKVQRGRRAVPVVNIEEIEADGSEQEDEAGKSGKNETTIETNKVILTRKLSARPKGRAVAHDLVVEQPSSRVTKYAKRPVISPKKRTRKEVVKETEDEESAPGDKAGQSKVVRPKRGAAALDHIAELASPVAKQSKKQPIKQIKKSAPLPVAKKASPAPAKPVAKSSKVKREVKPKTAKQPSPPVPRMTRAQASKAKE